MSSVHVVLFVFSLFIQDSPPARSDCKEWHECRQMALDAAARQEYEAFHDLAWRAVQTGPKNDPDLMYMLARAQSLSGRPGDALVMLQRLAQMGKKTDAATNDDFRRVRALPGWAGMEGTAVPGAAAPSPPATAAKEPVAVPPSRDDTRKTREDTKPNAPAAPAPPSAPAANAAEARAADSPLAPTDSLRFTATASAPAGLAYDAVSRRFIVADRDARKLTVVDEFSQHVANLASAQSAGFGNIAALEIDTRQGNLWVVSTGTAATKDPVAPTADQSLHTTLHKLQLISGRVLQSFVLPERLGAARFADVAVTPDSTVLVVDDSGQRIIRLRAKSTDLEVAATLNDRPLTIAPASDARAYVATADGIIIVDLGSRAVTTLKAASGVNLARVSRLRWHKGSLVGIQQNDGSYQAVRFTLDASGRRATRQQILDASLPTIEPTAAAVAGGALYYLATGSGSEMVIRKIALP
jgi:hypothetical protein